MKVFLNHKPVEVAGSEQTVQTLLEKEGLSKPGIAVAINNRVVPRKDWAYTLLQDDMKLTIIHAVCGG